MRFRPRISCVFGGLFLATVASAQQSAVQVRGVVTPAEPAASEPATPSAALGAAVRPATVDSVADDLQGIVILCATRPDSAEFEQEWSRFVAEQGVAESDLDALIADVLRRAENYRREQESNSSRRRVVDQSQTERMMHDTAKAIIQNMKG